MEARPVIINRAPTLHRYGVMAAWPRLVKGNVLKISPLVVKGFNADFDGDAMQFHVPAEESAVQEAVQKMLPSRNLFATRDFKVHATPLNEYIGGLFEASARIDKDKPPMHFPNKAAAIRAYRRGLIGVGQQIAIAEG
jgi:DNA-directed RNA polymerase subunit beta'